MNAGVDRPREAVLLIEANSLVPLVHDLAGGEAAVFSARCPGKETPNEDAAALIPFDEVSAVLAVADGVGSSPSGRLAAGEAMRALKAAMSQARAEGQPLRAAILDGLENANRVVLKSGIGSAATLAVVELSDGRVRPFHAGDCVILVMGQRGKLKLETVAHSPVGFAVEAGLLDHAEAMHHEDRHLVSNVLGSPDMRIEIGSWRKLAPRDTLILASDGLVDNLHMEEIVAHSRAGPIEAAAARLATAASARMQRPVEGAPSKPDDLTVVLYRPTRQRAPRTRTRSQ